MEPSHDQALGSLRAAQHTDAETTLADVSINSRGLRERLAAIDASDPLLSHNQPNEIFLGSTITLPQDAHQYERALNSLNEKIVAAERAVSILNADLEEEHENRALLSMCSWMWNGLKQEQEGALTLGWIGGSVATAALGAAIGVQFSSGAGILPGGILGGVLGLVGGAVFSLFASDNYANAAVPILPAAVFTPLLFVADLAVSAWGWSKSVLHKLSNKIEQLSEGPTADHARQDLANINRSTLSDPEKHRVAHERAATYSKLLHDLESSRKQLIDYGQRKFKSTAEADIGRTYQSVGELKDAFLPLETVAIVSPRSLLSAVINSDDPRNAAIKIMDFLGAHLPSIVAGGSESMSGSDEVSRSLNSFIEQLSSLDSDTRREKLKDLIDFLEATSEVAQA